MEVALEGSSSRFVAMSLTECHMFVCACEPDEVEVESV